jgi:signal transduction histidine kinase
VSIGPRLSLWFAFVLVAALLAMGMLSYYELVIEPRAKAAHHSHRRAKPEEGPIEEVLEALTWCAVPSLVFGLGGGWWLMRRMLAPIRELTQAAERITEHNFGTRLERTGNGDELDRLTQVFNEMTGRLQRSFSRIREFTLHASHELKTPLTVIHSELETALHEPALPSKDRTRLESQLDEIQRLTRIVDGLALLTKAGNGQLQLARALFRMDELMQEAAADAISLARSKRIDVKQGKCEPVSLVGDRHRMRQLLLNLTDNAVKYNHPEGTVELKLETVNGLAEITITNTGPGIAAEMLPKIFDPFFRANSTRDEGVDGSGLGLSIAQWIVNAHGGKINLVSEPGGLTIAKVRLPIAVEKHTKAGRASGEAVLTTHG